MQLRQSEIVSSIVMVVACFLAILLPPNSTDCGEKPITKQPRPVGQLFDTHGDPLPLNAFGRLGTVRWHHDIYSGHGFGLVGASLDGKVAFSVGNSGLRIWNAESGRQAKWLTQARYVEAAAMLPDGKSFVTVEPPKNKRGRVDGSVSRRILKYRQLGTGKVLRVKELALPPKSQPRYVMLSSDASLLVAYGGNGLVVVETKSGKIRLQTLHRIYYGNRVAISRNNKYLAVSVPFKHDTFIYSINDGKLLRKIKSPDRFGYFSVCLSPDGKSLFGSQIKDLYVLDVATGKVKKRLPGRWGHVAFSPDGGFVATTTAPAIRLYRWPSLKKVRDFSSHDDLIRAAAFSPDGRYLVAGHNYRVALWNVKTGKAVASRAAHRNVIYSLAFSPDGKQLAAGDRDGVVQVWDFHAQKLLQRFSGHYLSAPSVAFSPDGKLLATGDGYPPFATANNEARIRIWDLTTGRKLHSWRGHLASVFGLAFSPDGKRVVSAGGDARFRVWNSSGKNRLAQMRGGSGYKSFVLSSDGSRLLGYSWLGELALWDTNSGRKVQDFESVNDYRRKIYSVQILDNSIVSVEGRSRKPLTVRWWNRSTGKETSHREFGKDHKEACISPDGQTLAVATMGYPSHDVEVWDVKSGRLMIRLKGHTNYVQTMRFSPDGRWLATGGFDTNILLWDVRLLRLRFDKLGNGKPKE